jgi:hypothetical protein
MAAHRSTTDGGLSRAGTEEARRRTAARYKAGMPSTLCIVRHGQSSWNEKNLFTG